MIDIDILHADDDDGDAELTRRAFAKCDATLRVHRVDSGGRALEIARDVVPRLVVLDVNMPGMSGIETLRRLRADARFEDVPIVMLTSSELERDEAVRAGATQYLIKPSTLDALVALVSPLALLARRADVRSP